MMKLVCVLALNLLISVPTYALGVEQKSFNFTVDTQALMKGEVHYSLDLKSPAKFQTKYAELNDLDSLAILQDQNAKMAISKTAYIVNKPVGFFDHLKTTDEKFIHHVLGEQKVKKMADNDFKINVTGESSYSYKMKTYFDSDDISTLPNSKVVRAVTQAKKLDVISQSAPSTSFKELTKFTKFFVGGIQVSTYIPINDTKTLIINYSLFGVRKKFAHKKSLKQSLKFEAEAQKRLINSFK